MTIRRMSQRPHQRPMVAALSEHWQMFANLYAGSPGVDGVKLTTNSIRCFRFQIKTVPLRQTTRKKDVNARFGGCVLNRWFSSGRLQPIYMIHSQTQKADRASLDRCSPLDNRMIPRCTCHLVPLRKEKDFSISSRI